MSDALVNNLWLAPALPLLGAIVTALFGGRLGKYVAAPVIAGVGLAAVLAFLTLATFPTRPVGESEGGGEGAAEAPAVAARVVYRWIEAGDFVAPIELRADALSLTMAAMVAFVATLIVVFASGYMNHDAAQPRFFAVVGLFVFSMTGLVLSNNFALTYAFWEGVGVCSYLLIGHYHAKPSAAAAARKAFLVNRIGDVGFALAIFLIYREFGSLSYDVALGEKAALLPVGLATTIAGLLFWAACAKSAQVPLYTWLPDAMEGPTPVSALIHAATMVTAGVYLIARCYPIAQLAPGVLATIAVAGCLTALLGALIAVTRNDLKQVLAYSTVSQLGFMMMALGSGVGDVARFAVAAAIFHLLTHAFFKALLFLGSGSVMHAMGDVIDMRRFGGLYRTMPVTAAAFAVGALALAGFPFFSGFFSKDEILIALHEAQRAAGDTGWLYGLIYWIALLTAFLTAYYTTRAFCMTFLGPLKLPAADDPDAPAAASASAHGHDDRHAASGEESDWLMKGPLIVLAAFAFLSGILFMYVFPLEAYLETAPTVAALRHSAHHFTHTATMLYGTTAGLLGIGLGLFLHRQGVDYREPSFKPLAGFLKASRAKFHVDEFYEAALVAPLRIVAKLAYIVDVVLIEPLTRVVAWSPRLLARAGFAPAQNGLTQSYALFAALGVTALLIAFLLL